MMIAPSALRRVLLVSPMLVLAACNTVGEGHKIEPLPLPNPPGPVDAKQLRELHIRSTVTVKDAAKTAQ